MPYESLSSRRPARSEYISGVFLSEETFYQSTADGTPSVDILKANFVSGITLNKGTVDGETTT